MEELNRNKNKVLLILTCAIIIIVAAIVVVVTKGFNFELQYQKSQRIEVYLKKEFEVEEIKKLAQEVLEQEVLVQNVELYGDMASITAKEISEEQKNSIVEKVNEKYETELKAEEIEIVNVPHVKGFDIVKPYIIPFILSTLIILVYMAIRYKRLGSLKVIFKTLALIVLSEIILISIIAIARIPIGRLTVPMVLTVYLLTLVGITTSMEKKLKKAKAEKEEEKE